ncbi:hypothetical protein JCM3765_006209 [Sporobolomyces pararoseus]
MSVQPLQDHLAASLHISSPPQLVGATELPTLAKTNQNGQLGDVESDSEGEVDLTRDSKEEGGPTSITNESSPEIEPIFFPPLWLARRTAIYEKLKQQGIKSVADLGCGEGSLLSLLSVPAYHVDDFPSLYPPSTPAPPSVPSSCTSNSSFAPPSPLPTLAPTATHSKSDKLSILRSIPRPDPSHAELHLRKLVGIDADPKVCQIAKQVIKPNPNDSTRGDNRWIAPEFRFEELTTQLFCGNVEVFNDSLEDCEALVLTEIIEHMTASALSKLPNLLFNVYSPRLIVVTTPNHSFNPYFPDPSSSTSSSSRDSEYPSHHPDPTGRTSPPRIFRDPTHLFEFTPSEFESWCREALEQTGSTDEYSLSFTGVGSLASYYSSTSSIPFPPPSLSIHPALSSDQYSTKPVEIPERFYATQIAIFTKKYSNESERSPRSARPVPLPFFSPQSSPSNSTGQLPELSTPGGDGVRRECFPVPHKLVGSHIHKAHQLSSISQPKEVVLRELETLFNLNADSGGKDELEGNEVGETGWMVLSEIWRVGGLPSQPSQDQGYEGEGAGMCLRELVGGEIGALINILLEDESAQGSEWVFERVEVDRNGRSVQGIDALRIGWRGWEGSKPTEVYEIEQNGLDDHEEEGDGLVFDGLSQSRANGAQGSSSSGESTRLKTQNGSTVSSYQPNGVAVNGKEDWGNPETGGWNDEW